MSSYIGKKSSNGFGLNGSLIGYHFSTCFVWVCVFLVLIWKHLLKKLRMKARSRVRKKNVIGIWCFLLADLQSKNAIPEYRMTFMPEAFCIKEKQCQVSEEMRGLFLKFRAVYIVLGRKINKILLVLNAEFFFSLIVFKFFFSVQRSFFLKYFLKQICIFNIPAILITNFVKQFF